MRTSPQRAAVLFLFLGALVSSFGAVSVQGASPKAAATAGASDLSRSLLARLDFERLGLQLIGVATLGGRTSCFINIPGGATPQTFDAGESIGGFKIAQLSPDSVVFERDGATFKLALGGGSDEHSAPPQSAEFRSGADEDIWIDPVPLLQNDIDELIEWDAADASEIADPASIKESAGKLKTKTSRFASAKVIQDGWTVPRNTAPAGRPVRANLAAAPAASVRRVAGAPQFIYPIKGRLTSEFGYRRHPMGGGYRMHNGLDLAAPYGTVIHAAAAGVVSAVGYSSALGRYVYIKHDNGFETRYGHMASQSVKAGQRVAQGAAIGKEGSTGVSTGPHLHFEIRKDGSPLNPRYYLGN